jgi:hypothetical protein
MGPYSGLALAQGITGGLAGYLQSKEKARLQGVENQDRAWETENRNRQRGQWGMQDKFNAAKLQDVDDDKYIKAIEMYNETDPSMLDQVGRQKYEAFPSEIASKKPHLVPMLGFGKSGQQSPDDKLGRALQAYTAGGAPAGNAVADYLGMGKQAPGLGDTLPDIGGGMVPSPVGGVPMPRSLLQSALPKQTQPFFPPSLGEKRLDATGDYNNSKAFTSVLKSARDDIKQGGDAADIVPVYYAQARNAGYQGTQQEFMNHIASLNAISPEKAKAQGETNRHNVATEGIASDKAKTDKAYKDASLEIQRERNNLARIKAQKTGYGSMGKPEKATTIWNAIQTTDKSILNLKAQRDKLFQYKDESGIEGNYNKTGNLPASRKQQVYELNALIDQYGKQRQSLIAQIDGMESAGNPAPAVTPVVKPAPAKSSGKGTADVDNEVKAALGRGVSAEKLVQTLIAGGWTERGAKAKVKWLSGKR